MHRANLSFTPLELIDLDAWAAPGLALIGPDTPGPDDYFPERVLALHLYLDRLENTEGMSQVAARIEAFRDETATRLPRAFPH